MAPSLTPHRHAKFALTNSSEGPFIYSALSARKKKQEEIPWVLGDPADIAMIIHNPLPFELRVQKMVCTQSHSRSPLCLVSFPVSIVPGMYQSHSQSPLCLVSFPVSIVPSLIPSLHCARYVPVSFPVSIVPSLIPSLHCAWYVPVSFPVSILQTIILQLCAYASVFTGTKPV